MNKFIVVAILSTLAAFAVAAPSREKRQLANIGSFVVPREFQNINFEQYLKNPRAVQFQLKCVIYNGPCDTIGKYLKANIPNWLNTQCKNCNEMQKKQASKAITFFQSNYAKEWNDAVKKYRGAFSAEDVRRFESELGIKVTAEPNTSGTTSKPDTAGLVAIAKEAIETAKTTKEPLILEERSSTPAATATDASTTSA